MGKEKPGWVFYMESYVVRAYSKTIGIIHYTLLITLVFLNTNASEPFQAKAMQCILYSTNPILANFWISYGIDDLNQSFINKLPLHYFTQYKQRYAIYKQCVLSTQLQKIILID